MHACIHTCIHTYMQIHTWRLIQNRIVCRRESYLRNCNKHMDVTARAHFVLTPSIVVGLEEISLNDSIPIRMCSTHAILSICNIWYSVNCIHT